ncbi:hypothetical protein BV22DRAFT_1029027 [Leucogyrophana mollusca]|uniref:Uncharacterized protein n=1 Tax=Leucogyrophana mollusca TaxID=85980 RepID=A0ACB8BV55_9AGAM|nr:hypothetical protein BV22DRAFT_1029027 [Leucogyrophana mollusca]
MVENKPEPEPEPEPDLPPSYLSVLSQQPHQSSSCSVDNGIPNSSNSIHRVRSNIDFDKSLPARPSWPGSDQTSLHTTGRKSSSWLSFLPFASSRSAKQVRQSVLSLVHDLVASSQSSSPSRSPLPDAPAHELLASCAESCSAHKVSFSALLQEPSVEDHTPIYWAIVQYREDLLAALLTHAAPLTPFAISDIRRGCLVTSNQALFHALRSHRPPFHGAGGLPVTDFRSATDALLLGTRPADDVQVRDVGNNGAFIATFEIGMWQKRMRVSGRVGVEFIARGRIWSLIFFSTSPSSSTAPGRLKKSGGSWHVAITLLEHSPPTYLDSQLIIEEPTPQVAPSTSLSNPIAAASSSYGVKHSEEMYDYNYGGHYSSDIKSSSTTGNHLSSSTPSLSRRIPPPTHPHRAHTDTTVAPPRGTPILLRLQSGRHRLAHRMSKSGTNGSAQDPLTPKPDTWSEGGVDFTSAVGVPLGDGVGAHLMYDNPRYLTVDGTLRARFEARLTKTETPAGKDCVIC